MRKLYTRGKPRHTHRPWWGQDCRQVLRWDVRTVSSEKWKHTYYMSAIKSASFYLSKKSLVVFLLRVENHIHRVSDIAIFPFRHFTFTCKEDFLILSIRVQQEGPACPTGMGRWTPARQGPHWQGPIVCKQGEQSWTSVHDQGQAQPSVHQAYPQCWGGSEVKPGSPSAARGLEMEKEIR